MKKSIDFANGFVYVTGQTYGYVYGIFAAIAQW